jgi:hypothetical protein
MKPARSLSGAAKKCFVIGVVLALQETKEQL